MTIDEILKILTDAIKTPETVEEAIEYIKNDPVCQTTIEDLAFKQVVVNTLVASGIVTEEDFNKSIGYFKGLITKNFAENLLAKLGKENVKVVVNTVPPDEEQEIPVDDDDWESSDKIGKA